MVLISVEPDSKSPHPLMCVFSSQDDGLVDVTHISTPIQTRTLNTNRDYVTGSGAAVRRWRHGLPQRFVLVRPPDELFAWEGEEVSGMARSFFEQLTFQHLRDVQPGLAHASGAPSLPHYTCYWPMQLEGLFNELSFVRM